jgi:tetratricopeptide (TPR) repeat protein
VPKTTLDLKELLKEYEEYAGLAVSSLFFGSNGHQTRPVQGQIASYTRRTHATFKENELVKSIVQPTRVLMPNSPHDFLFKENSWCVNEAFLQVDFQRFPNYIKKIQLNHYFCRSASELEQKFIRGNFGAASWPHKRYDLVNLLATYEDTSILQNLEALFQQTDLDSRWLLAPAFQASSLIEKLAILARLRHPSPLKLDLPRPVFSFRIEFVTCQEIKDQLWLAENRRDLHEVKRLSLILQQKWSHNILGYFSVVNSLISLGDFEAAWQALSQAWQLSPNNYLVLTGMVVYFLQVKNFSMAEKSCQLLLEMAPHDLTVLGLMAEAMLGQGRYEDALNVGVPVVELSAQLGELPDRMGVFLVKKMADYLLEKKDYAGAVRLWQAGVMCQPGEVDPLLELAKVLLLAGEQSLAHQALTQAQQLAPQNEAVLAMLKQVNDVSHLSSPALRRSKRSH